MATCNLVSVWGTPVCLIPSEFHSKNETEGAEKFEVYLQHQMVAILVASLWFNMKSK